MVVQDSCSLPPGSARSAAFRPLLRRLPGRPRDGQTTHTLAAADRDMTLGRLTPAALAASRKKILTGWRGRRPALSSLQLRRCTEVTRKEERWHRHLDERHDAEQRMLGAVPGAPALGPRPGRRASDHSRHEYHHPAAGWGAARSVAQVLERAREPIEGPRALLRDEPRGRRLRLPRLRVARRPERACASTSARTASSTSPGRLTPATGRPPTSSPRTPSPSSPGWSDYDLEVSGPARRAAELRPGDRHVRADLLGRRVRARRRRRCAGWTSPRPGVVLHLGPAQQRGDVPLPALGARVRHEQPAGLLEHVPRGERPGADGGDRHAARARSTCSDWEAGRRDLADRRQRRVERAADAHLARRGRPARRAARPHQPADRGGLAADDRPARVRRHGDVPHDPRPAR